MRSDERDQLTQLTAAILEVFVSPNVSDSNFEAANLVDTTNNIAKALWAIARAIDRLADAQGAPPKEPRS